MTPDQSTQFDTFGCACRCLITLANANGGGYTKESFIDTYAPRYWAIGNQCGGLTIDGTKKLAVDMKLAKTVDEEDNFDMVRKAILGSVLAGLLVVTKKRYEADGRLSEYNHCTLMSHYVTQGNDLLYLFELEYLSGRAKGLFLPDASFQQLIPTFLLLRKQ